jgi:ATP-dependent DNA ligase
MNLPKFEDYKNQVMQYVSPKMDGHMCHVYIDERGNVRCMSKNNKDMTDKVMNVKHIKDELHRLPYSSELFAELHHPEVPATSVPTMLIEGDKRCRLSIFAAPILDGTDMRCADLCNVMEQLDGYGVETVPVIKCPAPGRLNQTMLDIMLMSATSGRFEGYVLKLSHFNGWFKFKPTKTIDAFVVDVTESDSKTYAGYMKAVKLGLYKDDGTVHDLGECGGGFTKEFKTEMPYKEMKELLIGRVGEFEFDSITAHGKLRFPRIAKDKNGFMIWRTDKDSHQCTTEQLL